MFFSSVYQISSITAILCVFLTQTAFTNESDLSSGAKEATSYHLFGENGTPHIHYNDIVANLQVYDEIKFSDGRVVRVGSILSDRNPGYSSIVVEDLVTGNAFKIPLAVSKYVEMDTRDYTNDFTLGMRTLNRYGVPSVKVVSSLSREYTEVERVEVSFSLSEYYQSRQTMTNREEIDRHLMEFSLKTAMFAVISDTKPENIVYTKNQGWIILDVGKEIIFFDDRPVGHEYHQEQRKKTIFSDSRHAHMPEDLRVMIQNKISQLRKTTSFRCSISLSTN